MDLEKKHDWNAANDKAYELYKAQLKVYQAEEALMAHKYFDKHNDEEGTLMFLHDNGLVDNRYLNNYMAPELKTTACGKYITDLVGDERIVR